jgi:ribosomal protein L1
VETRERIRTAENGNCQLSAKDRVEEKTKKNQRTFLHNMDAIAYAVEAWIEEVTGYSRMEVKVTVDIARTLGVPENEIKQWSAFCLSHDTEKLSDVKSLLERLSGSSLDR